MEAVRGTQEPPEELLTAKRGLSHHENKLAKFQNPEYRTFIMSLSRYKLLIEGMNEQTNEQPKEERNLLCRKIPNNAWRSFPQWDRG